MIKAGGILILDSAVPTKQSSMWNRLDSNGIDLESGLLWALKLRVLL